MLVERTIYFFSNHNIVIIYLTTRRILIEGDVARI